MLEIRREQKKAAVVETHVIALPLPFQGHVNPMFQFSTCLASKGLKVTVLTFTSKELTGDHHGPVNVEFFSDDCCEEENDGYFKNMEARMRRQLPEVVAKHAKSGYPVSCLIYDSLMHWVLDIARELGIAGAPLFTQSCAVNSIFCLVHEGKLNVPVQKGPVTIEGMPPLEIHDLPTFISDLEKYPNALKFMASQFLNAAEANWVFFNTFSSMEYELLSLMASRYPIKSVGPIIPSRYFDKTMEDNEDYGINFFKPNTESSMEWLDSKEAGSVVYISFGSITTLEEKQMEEIACCIKMSNHYFLWVVRDSEEEKLFRNFVEDTSDKVLIVNWCPQLKVLAHKSTGCFMTHCGWNSTLESLSLGVPMVAMPQWADQTTNAKFIADVWHVGTRAKVNEQGIVTREEIGLCISEVIEGETANEIRKNSAKWKILAKEAVNKGGSSERSIEAFVAELICKSSPL